jgi:kynurenine formamidase
MRAKLVCLVVICSGLGVWSWSRAVENAPAMKQWKPGKGWGWVWGKEDEIGSLNEMTDASRLAALQLVRRGQAYDLGVTYDRTSFKWPGHSPGEIMSFRTPEGAKRQADLPFVADDGQKTGWHSCALFINDNVATQIDGLAHATRGDNNHWYNGFEESKWGGDWGPRKCDASTIPPIVARGVLIDVAGYQGVDALPPNYPITVADLEGALRKQGTALRPGDVVLIRTGTLRYWGEAGGDHEKISRHDSAGIILESARWLVEQHGAMMIASDTSGLEWGPSNEQTAQHRAKYRSFMPAHTYLLIEQGVHIGELHYLEDLARDKVYEFCYLCTTAKIKGSTAGFALRPVAMR